MDHLGDIAKNRAAKRDHDDLNHELAGLDVGRQKRFLPEGSRDTPAERQQKSERRATLSALQLLMLQDAEYAALRHRVETSLEDANHRLTEMHSEAEDLHRASLSRLEALEARAGELPDGTKVFRSRDGTVFTAEGRALDGDERADVSWKPDAPSWEEYKDAREAHEKIEAYRAKIEAAQDDVDGHQESLDTDSDNPLSTEDLEGIDRSISDTLTDLEQMRTELMSDPQPEATLASDMNILDAAPEATVPAGPSFGSRTPG